MSEDTKNPELELDLENKAPEEQTGGSAPEPEQQPEQPTLEEQLAEQSDKYMRLAAEYDNFRKRTARERESLTATATPQTTSRDLTKCSRRCLQP